MHDATAMPTRTGSEHAEPDLGGSWRQAPPPRAWLILAATVVLATAAKYAIASNSPGPILFSDELIFSHFSWQLREFGYAPVPNIQFGATYVPPLYPLVLVPATFVSKWYAASLLINALLSSLACIPVYFLGVRYVSRTTALIVAIIAATFPAHWIYSSLFMSENLFLLVFFLLLLAMSEYLQSPSVTKLILLAVALGLAFLTRQIVLAILPIAIVLVAYAEMPQRLELSPRLLHLLRRRARHLLGRVALFIASFLAVVSPWIAYGLHAGDLTGVLGLRSSPLRGNPPLENLGSWVLYYAAYMVVISASFLFATATALASTTPMDDVQDRLRPLALTAGLASVGLLVPAMRHSFRVYDDFGKIHGRYITYLFVVALLLALALVEHRRSGADGRRRPFVRGLLAIGASAFIASASAAVLQDQGFMTMTNSPEGYSLVNVLGVWWVGATAGAGVLIIMAALRWRRATPRTLAHWLAAFVLGATSVASLMLVRSDPLRSHDRASHARAIADVVQMGDAEDRVVVFDTEGGMTRKKVTRLEDELQFWRVRDHVLVRPLSDVLPGSDLRGLPEGTLIATPRDLPFVAVSAYRYRGNLWHVFELKG